MRTDHPRSPRSVMNQNTAAWVEAASEFDTRPKALGGWKASLRVALCKVTLSSRPLRRWFCKRSLRPVQLSSIPPCCPHVDGNPGTRDAPPSCHAPSAEQYM